MRNYLLIILLSLSSFTFAQSVKKDIVDGNKAYNAKKYKAADQAYQNALKKNSKSFVAAFNQGDALYKQGKYKAAAQTFQDLAAKAPSKELKAKSFHNLGNSLLRLKKYQESVNAYKNSLKINPNDKDTRYNLAYALSKLKHKKQQQKQNKKNNKNKQNKNQNQKNKNDKNKQNKKNQDKNNKDKNKQNQNKNQQNKDKQNQQKQQQPKNQLSKQDAKRMLDELNNEEKNVQKNLNRKKEKVGKASIQKNW